MILVHLQNTINEKIVKTTLSIIINYPVTYRLTMWSMWPLTSGWARVLTIYTFHFMRAPDISTSYFFMVRFSVWSAFVRFRSLHCWRFYIHLFHSKNDFFFNHNSFINWLVVWWILSLREIKSISGLLIYQVFIEITNYTVFFFRWWFVVGLDYRCKSYKSNYKEQSLIHCSIVFASIF